MFRKYPIKFIKNKIINEGNIPKIIVLIILIVDPLVKIQELSIISLKSKDIKTKIKINLKLR